MITTLLVDSSGKLFKIVQCLESTEHWEGRGDASVPQAAWAGELHPLLTLGSSASPLHFCTPTVPFTSIISNDTW